MTIYMQLVSLPVIFVIVRVRYFVILHNFKINAQFCAVRHLSIRIVVCTFPSNLLNIQEPNLTVK